MVVSLHSTKQTVLTPLCLLASFTLVCNIPHTPPAIAQIVPDNSLGSEGSVVVPNQNIRGINSDRIDGGAVRGGNLFHSFQEFNVDVGRGAYFSNPDSIVNILTRVTGDNISNILGTLGVLGNANLFLINPNGIVFGPNARLDVGGSFFASTADGILFENGVEFAASNPEAPPLLTINIPLGLNIRENPGNIVNQTLPQFVEINGDIPTATPSGLYVPPEETIAFIGGEVRFESGVVASPGSRIELGGLSEPGIVQLNSDGSLSFPANIQRADVLLTNDAVANVAGNPGGNIAINARNLEISGGSQVTNGVAEVSSLLNFEDRENLETEPSQAGDIRINATESIRLTGQDSIIGNILFPNTTGNSGNIEIQTNLLSVRDGAQISASTFGNGNGGNLTVTATDVELIDTIMGASVQRGATGNGGTLTVNTQNLLVRDGAQIFTGTFGNGDGGNLTVTATDVEIIGTAADTQFLTGLRASVEAEATGNGGTLTLNTQNLSVRDGAQISASTFGNGNGGNLTVTANNVELIGTSADGQFPSILAASVNLGATGNGGTLTVNTQNLLVRDGAQIFTGTFGNGDGGNLTVTANNMELVGRSAIGPFSSQVGVSVQAGATGNGGTLTLNTQNLSVRDGARISASTFGNGNGGNLTVTANNVELVGTSADGQFPSGLRASVEQGAIGNGGTVIIDTQHLLVRDGAQINAATAGNGTGGDLTVNATDVELVGGSSDGEFSSGLGVLIQPGAIGNGGTLTVNTQNLSVQDGALISAATFGNGNGGNLTVTANNVELVGTTADGQFSSQLGASVEQGAIGNGGTLTLNTQNLSVRDGAQISAATFGNGNGGNLTVTANNVELVGTAADGQFSSGLGASVEPRATGNGGTLTLNTQNLSVRDGAQIGAATFGEGDGGNLTVTANDVELVGRGSLLGASVVQGATGNGGTLIVNTQNLSVRDGAQISASTFGNGNGGNLTVTANNVELLSGSLLGASVEPGATGNGGTLIVNTQNLLVRDGAQILTATFGNGDGGNLTVTANDVELVGASSVLAASALSTSTGRGGILTVNTEQLTIRDGASIDVRSEGIEGAGDLIINAPNIFLDNQASLNGETTAGEGNIILNTSDLRLRRNSNITTNATGQATGGNITINTDNLIAIEDSDISANAEDAFGGQVIINADALFGTQFRPQQTNASDITATSELGPQFSGTVQLNTEFDPSAGLVEIPQNIIDPAALIAQDFCKLRGDSEFIITGRGGLASSPNDTFTGDRPQVTLVEPVEPVRSRPNRSTSTQRPRTEPNQPRSSADIIPARGWIRDENGDVILVSYDPTKTGVRRQPVQDSNQCNP